jgi:hypothetical protein
MNGRFPIVLKFNRLPDNETSKIKIRSCFSRADASRMQIACRHQLPSSLNLRRNRSNFAEATPRQVRLRSASLGLRLRATTPQDDGTRHRNILRHQLNGTNNNFNNESRLYCQDLIYCDKIENSNRFVHRSPVCLRLEFLKVGFNRVLRINQVREWDIRAQRETCITRIYVLLELLFTLCTSVPVSPKNA